MAMDSSGNLLLSDMIGNCIRKINTTTSEVSTFAGTCGAADMANPTGVAVDSSDNLYVADSSYGVVRKITPGGVMTTYSGQLYDHAWTDGDAASAKFGYPQHVTVDGSGNVYVSDLSPDRVRKIAAADGAVTTLAGTSNGFLNGAGSVAKFDWIYGIVSDSAGNVYVSDTGNARIRKIGAPATAPAQPSVTASGGNGQVSLAFATPADNGATLSGYTVVVTPSGGSAVTLNVGASNTSTITVSGVTTSCWMPVRSRAWAAAMASQRSRTALFGQEKPPNSTKTAR